MSLTHHLINALSRRADLTPREYQLLTSIEPEIVSFERGEVIVPARAKSHRSCVIAKGMAARVHDVEGRPGERVISALHIAGDFVDLHGFVLVEIQHDIISIGPSTVQFAQHSDLKEIMLECPNMTRLLWLMTVIDGSIHRQWLVASTSLRATPHLAHLLCEIYVRMEIAGVCAGLKFSLPLLQRELATVLGYSPIHINRAVRDLRDRGLVKWSLNQIEILDWTGLTKIACFDPRYLELDKIPR